MSARAVAALVSLAALLAPSGAGAQGEVATGRARTLFEEGRAAAEAHDWALAAERFRQTLAIRATPAVHYNLGVSLVELGHLLEGIEHLEAATTDPTFATAARELIASSQRRLARIVLDVPAGSWSVLIDGEPLPAELLGSEVPVDPRECPLELVRADGSVAASTTIQLDEGETRHVELSAPAVTSAATATDDGPAVALTIIAGGLSAVGLLLTGLAVWSWTDAASGLAAYNAAPTPAGLAEGQSRAERTDYLGAFAAATLAAATISWIGAGQLLSQRPADPVVSVAIHDGGAVLLLRGRW